MAIHTPGPWKVDPKFVYEIQTSDGKREIATAYWPDTNADEEIEANAHLIAAAPEMLNMLIELQESAQYWSEYDVPVGIVDRLNAVINKAKGDSRGESD